MGVMLKTTGSEWGTGDVLYSGSLNDTFAAACWGTFLGSNEITGSTLQALGSGIIGSYYVEPNKIAHHVSIITQFFSDALAGAGDATITGKLYAGSPYETSLLRETHCVVESETGERASLNADIVDQYEPTAAEIGSGFWVVCIGSVGAVSGGGDGLELKSLKVWGI